MAKDGVLDKGDPTKIFKLIEEIAVGSYGRVYKVSPSRSRIRLSLHFIWNRPFTNSLTKL